MTYRSLGLAVFLVMGGVAAALAEGSQPAESCLVWKVEEFSAASSNSSCSFYNREKVSTRVLVKNHCESVVTGVFTYYKSDDDRRPVMNMRPFAVKPGRIVEVANPCDISNPASFQVSQVSFNSEV